jgi:small redox-active disulfide protein 2
VGILGLNEILGEMVPAFADRADDEVQAELLKRVSKRNYIPGGAREAYGKALLNTFMQALGKPVHEESSPSALVIKVLGPGCAQCDRLDRELMGVMSELGLAGDLEHVRDIKEIAKYGVMGTPALIINGQVKSVGKVPPRNKLIEWLKAEAQTA